MKSNRKKDANVKLIIFICWLVYTCSYVGKLGYSANIVQIEACYGISHAQAGIVGTFFFFAYGGGQIANGIFCKKYNVKYAVFFALLISAICNLSVALSDNFSLLKYIWLINGLALSALWPMLIRFLSEQLDKKDLSKAVFSMGTTVAVGTFVTYGACALFVFAGNFRLIFYFASVLLPVIAVVWFFLNCKTVARRAGEEKTEPSGNVTALQEGGSGKGFVIFVAVLAVFAIVTNLVKDGLTTWIPMILKELYYMPDYLSILLTLFLPVLAIFGTALSMGLHKKIKDFILLCAFLFAVASGLIVGVAIFSAVSPIVTVVCFSLVSLLMSATNNVITSMVPLYLKGKTNSGMLAGIMNGFCYVGSTISAYGLGTVGDDYGWISVFRLLAVVCGVCVFLASIWTAGAAFFRRKKKEREEKRDKDQL